MSLTTYLETIYGRGSGYVHLSTTKRQLAAVECSAVAELAEVIDGRRDVYLSAAVVGTEKGSGAGGRIVDADAAELTALWVDLDRAGEPGHKTDAALWTREDIGKLWDWLGAIPAAQPSAVVDSGGGWWLWFVLAEPVPLNGDGSGELLLARWARWWESIGAEFGRQVDSVFNPGRIARAPGSINTKAGRERPAVVKSIDPSRVYTLEELDALLPAPESPRIDWAKMNGDRPGDTFNREATVAGMVALLEGHGFHSPKGKGGRVDLTRAGKAARDGHSVTVWPDASVTFWSSAAEALPGKIELRDRNRASGTYDPFGVFVHAEHGGDFEAAARALNPRFEVKVPRGRDDGEGPPAVLPFLTLAELAAKVDAAGPRRYLIRGIWPAGVYGVHAAEAKAQKTWNVGDLAVSVASGTPWLDHFPIDDPGPVVIFAGEGGEASIVRRLRAICDSRGLRAEDLDIHVCARAPHLKDDEHMAAFAEKVAEVEPKLIVLDPFYLSAVGAKGGDLYGMGELLERAQIVSETYAAALVVVTHFNRGNRSGTNRITGAGPAEWARVVIGADVKSRHRDPDTKATTVVTALDVIGGEVPESAFRLKRVICADDPDDLSSPLRYSVEVLEDDDHDHGADDDIPPARRKLLEAVAAIGQHGATGRELVDWIVDKYGHGLYRQTVSTELNTAQADGLVDSLAEPGKATIWFPPGGVSGGVVTTPTRHQPTGETRGVSSSSSHVGDDDTPTPRKQAFDLSPEEIAR